MKKLQAVDQLSSAILVEGFDEFTHSANNERSVISERPLADIDDMIDFELSADEMTEIDALNRNLRAGPDPRRFDVHAFKAAVAQRAVRVY